jgi:hypothetical protein
MSTLTWLTNAVIRDNKAEMDGRVLSRPALLVTDGTALIYAVDVDVGIVDTTGYDEAQDLVNAKVLGSILHAVPIARGNQDLIYADVGAAVRVRRSASGGYEVVGFSQTMPGKNVRIPVDLDLFAIGEVEDRTITARPLTLGEIATFGGFGVVPLGAVAVFRGSTLIRLTA